MLDELKFVQGAVAKKDLLPALTHFRIEDGHVRSFNGTLALSSPIAFDINCTPKGLPFVKAIQNCKDTVVLSMTPKGRLSVKSGKFKAFIDCVDTETPHVVPDGAFYDINGEELLKAFKTVAPLISNDASKPWSNGVLLKGQSAFATNNIVIAEYWVGSVFPITCNVPGIAIKEMLRIGKPPTRMQATETSISFHYEDERWIRSSLYDTAWPDIGRILDVPSMPVPFDDRIFEALDVVKPFVDKLGRVYIQDQKLMTHLEETEGASFDLEGITYNGVFQRDMLLLLKGIAKQADFTLYPKPCLFYGDNIRGAIIGMRI